MSAFDEKLKSGQGVTGTFCHLGGTAVAECLSLSGLDYVIIDTEHAAFSEEHCADMIRAIQLHGAEAFVRVRDSSRAAILHALDSGARGIIVPDVHSLEEAEALLRYANYFPCGVRGVAFSRSAKYGFAQEMNDLGTFFEETNRRVLLMPQCETLGALQNIETLAAMEGIDGIFVGPYDLSVALGFPAKFSAPEFQDALSGILEACRTNGKAVFIYANTMQEARTYFAQGYQGVAVGTDTSLLVRAIQNMLQS